MAKISQQIIQSPQVPAGLFDKIICAIKLEQEFKKTKELLLMFASLLLISMASMPFSFAYFFSQMQESAILYFISTAMQNVNIFFVVWQDFLLSILESLPLMSIFLFSLNLALFVFTVRLFLYKKGLLLKYLSSQLKSYGF